MPERRILPPESQPWGREVDKELATLRQQVEILNLQVSNNYAQQASGFQLVGDRLRESGLNVPVGALLTWTSLSLPNDAWLWADGSAVSRIVYNTLFSVFGENFGAGDGSTTFNVPNISGKMLVNYSSGDGDFGSLGATGGSKTHTLTTSEIPSHSHSGDSHRHTAPNATTAIDISGSGLQSGSNRGLTAIAGFTGFTSADTGNTGGGNPHNNLPPFFTLPFIIKAY